jgi:hypothetical protein
MGQYKCGFFFLCWATLAAVFIAFSGAVGADAELPETREQERNGQLARLWRYSTTRDTVRVGLVLERTLAQ